jgi:hypothetical protein
MPPGLIRLTSLERRGKHAGQESNVHIRFQTGMPKSNGVKSNVMDPSASVSYGIIISISDLDVPVPFHPVMSYGF